MSTLAIEGMQWGDEGKGKLTDYFASRAEVVVRSQGGNNAGHSIVRDGKRYALRLLPSGIFNPDVVNVLADGMVINPFALVEEIEGLKAQGVTKFKLLISNRASMLLPYHVAIDHAREAMLGNSKIGTTGRGIGPCYEDKAARLGLRMGDLLDEKQLESRLEGALNIKNRELIAYGAEPFKKEDILKQLHEVMPSLIPFITDTSAYLRDCLKQNKKVLFEGAQGAMLCLTHGTYPYVTSSSPLATAIPVNTGLPLTVVNEVLGVMKAYTTRVGEGPFPTELFDEIGNEIREKGHEYGTVTKRPRRVGWLDLAVLRYVKEISGITHVGLMLLDVLGGLDQIKVCTGYKIDGKLIDYMPCDVPSYSKVEPVYVTLPGWKEDISNVLNYDDLPQNAKRYVEEIEKALGVSVAMVSVGPDHKQTIIREELFK